MRFPAYWLFIVDVELEPRKEPAEKFFLNYANRTAKVKIKIFIPIRAILKIDVFPRARLLAFDTFPWLLAFD